MTQQTNGTPDLKYSQETFKAMYEAIKHFIDVTKKAKGVEFSASMIGAWIDLNKVLPLAEGREK